jgi:hypothetical protein
MPTDFRSPKRNVYELQGGSYASPHIHVGATERSACDKARELLTGDEIPLWSGLELVRLYHTHPSPGPVRRYVGTIGRDGVLHRAG